MPRNLGYAELPNAPTINPWHSKHKRSAIKHAEQIAGREVVMLTDPCATFELGVIVTAVIFLAWILSPAQRSRIRREAARDRIAIRRALADNTAARSAQPISRPGSGDIGCE
jgi:hypothetical protein